MSAYCHLILTARHLVPVLKPRIHIDPPIRAFHRPLMARPIAIIGGSPCGLTLARLLQRKGIDYTVYERDTAIQEKGQGGTLDLHFSTGQEALRQAGLVSEFDALARWDASGIEFTDRYSGETFFRFGHGHNAVEVEKGERSRPEIDRRQLRQTYSIPSQ